MVSLPSPHHRWLVSNSSVAKVDSTLGTTNALRLGLTNVIVEDTRVAGHIQVSSLKVVLPDFLSLYMAPLSVSGYLEDDIQAIPSMARWFVVSGRQYLIQVKAFSQGSDAQEIYITEVGEWFSSGIIILNYHLCSSFVFVIYEMLFFSR